jgi:predicted nuclease of restriction endonuclease-like (RecB) superfamily
MPLASLYTRIRQILESARTRVARSVNTTQVVANWLIGREIVEEEQKGQRRAGYGDRVLLRLADQLKADFGDGYGLTNLKLCRKFFLIYPDLVGPSKGHTVRDFLGTPSIVTGNQSSEIGHTPCDESWQPGRLHPNLAWSLYRHLIKVDAPNARAFYEIEAVKECWSARELERQVASLLFERLAKSRDKAGVLRLAKKGHEIMAPSDIFKDPVMIEFLGLPESPRLTESALEQALLDQLQSFLLELGKGFAFVARQQRLTLDGDHFYIDLVFYHVVLKCYVLLELKVGKLTHGDLGQVQLYVNYYDREKRTAGDNPTLGLILCTDKNDAVVKYTLGADQENTIFASRYKLHLPSEAELKAEVRRELKQITSSSPSS